MSRRTVITDEYHFESVDEKTVRYEPPPSLRIPSPIRVTTTTIRSTSPILKLSQPIFCQTKIRASRSPLRIPSPTFSSVFRFRSSSPCLNTSYVRIRSTSPPKTRIVYPVVSTEVPCSEKLVNVRVERSCSPPARVNFRVERSCSPPARVNVVRVERSCSPPAQVNVRVERSCSPPARVNVVRVERSCSPPARNSVLRSSSFISTSTEKINQTSSYNYDYRYDFKETVETTKKVSLPPSKSLTNISTCWKSSVDSDSRSRSGSRSNLNSVTYVYDNENDNRRVTFVKQTNADSGLSLPGCLVRASSTFLPVNRSVQVGSIFNGNAFGLLSSHITIRDSFHTSFQFKTSTTDGILMIVVDEASRDSFFIELYDSQLKATLLIDGEPDSCWTDFEWPVLSNDIWSDVDVKIVGSRLTLTVRNKYFTKTHRCHLRQPIRGDLYIAGHPATILPPFACHSRNFFVGEMRNFYVNENGVKWYGVPSASGLRLRNWY